jgi:hypothetical protein
MGWGEEQGVFTLERRSVVDYREEVCSGLQRGEVCSGLQRGGVWWTTERRALWWTTEGTRVCCPVENCPALQGLIPVRPFPLCGRTPVSTTPFQPHTMKRYQSLCGVCVCVCVCVCACVRVCVCVPAFAPTVLPQWLDQDAPHMRDGDTLIGSSAPTTEQGQHCAFHAY